MSNETSYTRSELANDLRVLCGMPVNSKSDLSDWYEYANRVLGRLSCGSESELGSVPEFVWHYLADADIRLKDASYRELQEKEVLWVIAALEMDGERTRK